MIKTGLSIVLKATDQKLENPK